MAGIIKDLDHWAEDKFSSLCAAAGVTRNKSQQDRTGWDYLIEFPPKRLPHMPLDLQPPSTTARVQVKSKGHGRPSITLKLSNALLFAKEPAPCFLVLFLARNGAEPVHIYAKHFWEGMISDTLRKARSVDPSDQAEPHKVRLSVTFTQADSHTDDLLTWITSQATSLGADYASEKAKIVSTVGFAEGGYQGSISLRLGDLKALVDHQIGLVPAAPIERVSLSQRRFGVDFLFPIPLSKPDFVSLRSHPHPCRLRLRQSGFLDVWVDAELFVPGIPDLPPELQKCRVVGDFLDLVFSNAGDGGTANFQFLRDKQRSLAGIRALIDVLAMIENGPIDVSIQVPEGVLRAAKLTIERLRVANWLGWFKPGVRCLELVAANAAPSDLRLSVPEIEAAWDDLAPFNALVAGEVMTGSMTLDRPVSLPPNLNSFYAYGYVDVGAWSFMAVVARTIDAISENGAEINFHFGEPRIVESLVRRGKGVDYLQHLITLYRAAMRAPDAGPALELCDGDFRAIAGHLSDRETAI